MKKTIPSLLFFPLFVLSALGLHAEEKKAISLSEVVVTETVIKPETEMLQLSELLSPRFVNLGQALEEIPGVAMVRRSANATEPVLRGMNWERVATQINHLPIYGACPARMDPPVIYTRAQAAEAVIVVKGVPSVTLGPAGTGGRIIIKTDYERDAAAEPGMVGWVQAGYDSAREGISGGAGMRGGNRFADVKVAVEGLDYGDYESAKGTDVPASQEGHGATLNLGFRPRENHRWWNSLNYVREDDVDYPALPMNLVSTDYVTFNTGYRVSLDQGTLKEIDTSFGLLDTDHVMNNTGKPSRAAYHNSTETAVESFSGLVKLAWRLSENTALTTGVDVSYLHRDALRKRIVVATGKQFFDHIWPDVVQRDFGGFAEISMVMENSWRLRLGARVDRVASDADGTHEMSLQKQTIQENFVRFFGPGASDTDTTETVGSGNFLLEWAATDQMLWHVGAGVSSRAAGLTERFFAFAPAPGGFQVGNPSLDPEVKYEIETGVETKGPWSDFSIAAYFFRVEDYIMPFVVGREDVNGDGRPDLIRGFTNVNAELYGLEAAWTLKIGRHWRFPVSIAYVRGKNTENDRDLPEMPPLAGRAAIRYSEDGRVPYWIQFGGRFAAKQDKVDPLFPEDDTAGFSVFHLRAGMVLKGAYHIEAGIENLFEHHYNEHLTREALLPVGDLAAGDEVAAPGRSFYAGLRIEF